MTKLKIYSIITTVIVLIVLLQGALVTKTGSGQGCGTTWPLCFGDVIPYNPTLETIIEYTHRLISSTAGLLVLILSFWSWRKLKHMKEIKFFAILASAAIIVQGLMGAGQVVFAQMFHRKAGMLLTVLIAVFVVWVLKQYKHQRLLVTLSVISMLLIVVQLISGIGMIFTSNQNLTFGLIHALVISIFFALFVYMIVITRRGK